MKKIILLTIALGTVFSNGPAVARFQLYDDAKIEEAAKISLKFFKVEAKKVIIVNTGAEITKRVLRVEYTTPDSESINDRFTKILSVFKMALYLNNEYGARIDHSWVSVKDPLGGPVASFVVATEATRKNDEKNDLTTYFSAWLADYHNMKYFAGLRDYVVSATSDSQKRAKYYKIVDEIQKIIDPTWKVKSGEAGQLYAAAKQEAGDFHKQMIERNVMMAVETETSNPVIFLGDGFFELDGDKQHEFFKRLFDNFVASNHKDLKTLIFYDPLNQERVGTYDKNGFKPDK